MSIRDVADLLFAARERVDFYWNFYVVVVIAVIGWLVSLKKTLTRSMKLLVSVAYVIAAVMNYVGLYGSYTFAEALRRAARHAGRSPDGGRDRDGPGLTLGAAGQRSVTQGEPVPEDAEDGVRREKL